MLEAKAELSTGHPKLWSAGKLSAVSRQIFHNHEALVMLQTQ